MRLTLPQLMALGCLLASGCFMHHSLDPAEDAVDPALGAAGEDDGSASSDDASLDELDVEDPDEGFGFPEPDPDDGFGFPEPDPDDPSGEEQDCEDPANDFEAWLCELEEGEEDDPFEDPFAPPDNPFDPPDNPFLPDDPAEEDPLAEVCEDPGFFAQLICGLFGGEGGGFGNPAPEPEPEPEPDDGQLDCSRDDLSGFEQFLCDLQQDG